VLRLSSFYLSAESSECGHGHGGQFVFDAFDKLSQGEQDRSCPAVPDITCVMNWHFLSGMNPMTNSRNCT